MLKFSEDYRKRSGEDRRSGIERRTKNDPDFLKRIGFERRRYVRERRMPGEYRKGWARLNTWKSVPLGIQLKKKSYVSTARSIAK